MSTKLVEIYDAIWSALDENVNLAAFLAEKGGRTYRHSAADKAPGEWVKARLPALVMTPQGLEEQMALSGYAAGTIVFDIEMHVAQRDLDVLLDLVWHVGAALKEKLRGSDANLGLSYVAKVALGDVRFERWQAAPDSPRDRFWSAIRSIAVEYYDAIAP